VAGIRAFQKGAALSAHFPEEQIRTPSTPKMFQWYPPLRAEQLDVSDPEDLLIFGPRRHCNSFRVHAALVISNQGNSSFNVISPPRKPLYLRIFSSGGISMKWIIPPGKSCAGLRWESRILYSQVGLDASLQVDLLELTLMAVNGSSLGRMI
jgi:hypothetical protein